MRWWPSWFLVYLQLIRGRRGRDRMVVRFTTTYAICLSPLKLCVRTPFIMRCDSFLKCWIKKKIWIRNQRMTTLKDCMFPKGPKGRLIVRFTTTYAICLSPLKLCVRTPFIMRCTRYNMMWWSLSLTCGRLVVFSAYSGFLHQ
jgi:hypothetical protein